jgi:hypothetical protein
LNASEHESMSEEELRARLEEELKRIKVDDVLLQTVVTLVNLGGQRLGLGEGGEEVRDLEQTRTAIDAVRALLPLLEGGEGDGQRTRPIRDALAQLQMAYAREVGAGTPAGEEDPEGPGGETPAREAQREPSRERPQTDPGAGRRPGRSGRLWVPPGSAT